MKQEKSSSEFHPVVCHSLRTADNQCPNHLAILVGVGTKRVRYIPFQENGLRVYNVLQDTFLKEWGPQLDVDVVHAAKTYLDSYQAKYYISEEARAVLQEIIRSNGASSTITDKEHIMSQAQAQTTSKKSAAKAPTKASAKKPAAKATKATASKKPAAKKAEAAKPAMRYAGMKVTALKKPADLTSREGTWSHFMQHTAITSKTTDDAQAKVDASKEYSGNRMDWNFLTTKQFVKLA